MSGAGAQEFAGRVALVTGAAGAIGQVICRRMARGGAAIVALDMREARANEIVAQLQEEFDVPVMAVCVDIADRPAVDAAIERVQRDLAVIDILINNAALNVQGSIFAYEPEDFDRIIDVDLTACWYLMRAVLPGMRELGRGAIVNVTSVAAYLGGRGREAPYSAAKAALHDLTRSTAIEGGPYGIRCNAVAPGIIHSKFLDNHRERFEVEVERTPLRRHGRPEEVADVIAFLSSDASSFVTGEIVNVSGGWYLRP